jgi:hypothetical protein
MSQEIIVRWNEINWHTGWWGTKINNARTLTTHYKKVESKGIEIF